MTLDRDPIGKHNLPYLRGNMQRTLLWLGQHVLPPTEAAAERRLAIIPPAPLAVWHPAGSELADFAAQPATIEVHPRAASRT